MNSSLRILIIGQNGQVSQALQKRLAAVGELIVLGSSQLDMARTDDIRAPIDALRPDLIINAAAHTAVDQAESEAERAFAINATAPGVLARTALERSTVSLLHRLCL
jgi:dTDP-4-dehydrorhamnose reductase